MDQALVDAAVGFCEGTLALRETLDNFYTAPGQAEYDLDAPVGQEVARVLAVTMGGRSLTLAPKEQVHLLPASSGSPTHAHVVRDGDALLLVLSPTPDAVELVKVTAALRPPRSATQLHDALFTRWAGGIAAGALVRILSVPNQPFSDPQAAMYYAGIERMSLSSARVEGSYDHVRGQMRITQRPFA